MVFEFLPRLHQRILLLGPMSAQQKLATFLLELRPLAQAPEQRVLAMSRCDIADYLVLSVETVSRTLSLLRSQGWIRFLHRRRIQIVDRAALERLAAGAIEVRDARPGSALR